GAGSGADGSRDRGASAHLGRPREPRDRRAALPLGGDGEEPRPAPFGQAAGPEPRPRGRRRPPPRPDRLARTTRKPPLTGGLLRCSTGFPPSVDNPQKGEVLRWRTLFTTQALPAGEPASDLGGLDQLRELAHYFPPFCGTDGDL